MFFISGFSLVPLSLFWIIPESPRWLCEKNKIGKASTICKKAAKMNKLETKSILNDLVNYSEEDRIDLGIKETIKYIKTKPIFKIYLLSISFNCFTIGICYFTLVVYAGNISGNLYINISLCGGITIPALLIGLGLHSCIPSKWILSMSSFIVTTSYFIMAFISQTYHLRKIILPTIMFCIGIQFSAICFALEHTFHKKFRKVIMDGMYVIGRIGAMLSPFMFLLKHQRFVISIILGSFAFISSILAFLLPENLKGSNENKNEKSSIQSENSNSDENIKSDVFKFQKDLKKKTISSTGQNKDETGLNKLDVLHARSKLPKHLSNKENSDEEFNVSDVIRAKEKLPKTLRKEENFDEHKVIPAKEEYLRDVLVGSWLAEKSDKEEKQIVSASTSKVSEGKSELVKRKTKKISGGKQNVKKKKVKKKLKIPKKINFR